MSLKEWSAAQSAAAKGKSGDKSKDAPAADQPPAEPEKTPAEVAPTPKS